MIISLWIIALSALKKTRKIKNYGYWFDNKIACIKDFKVTRDSDDFVDSWGTEEIFIKT